MNKSYKIKTIIFQKKDKKWTTWKIIQIKMILANQWVLVESDSENIEKNVIPKWIKKMSEGMQQIMRGCILKVIRNWIMKDHIIIWALLRFVKMLKRKKKKRD